MEIRVKLFAVFRERAGAAEIAVDLPAGATAGDVVCAVTDRFPALGTFTSRVAIAVNLETVPRSTVIRPGDEVALIPPVSGGCR
jgi:molybdopterin converting factor subunit 1